MFYILKITCCHVHNYKSKQIPRIIYLKSGNLLCLSLKIHTQRAPIVRLEEIHTIPKTSLFQNVQEMPILKLPGISLKL